MAGDQLVERVRGTRTRVLAWRASSTTSSGAAHDGVVYLAADASMAAAKQAAQHLLRTHSGLGAQGGATTEPRDVDLDSLAERIRGRLGASNVAFYVPTPDGLHFRAVSTSRAGVRPSTATYDLRGVFARVAETRNVVTSGDVRLLADHESEPRPSAGSPGLIALPLIRGGRIDAVACAYEDAGLVLRQSAVDAVAAMIAAPARCRAVVEASPERMLPVAAAAAPVARPGADSAATVEARQNEVAGTLTLLERKSGEAVAVRELARARREQRQLSVVLFELGRQTTVGAPAQSSDTLAPVVDTFLKAVRQSDLPIRWAANELLLILPGLAGAEARYVAERVRAAMQAGARHSVAVAGGVAEADPAERQFEEVVERARARVAMAVDRGHNRVH
jgi:GGDEF domain-containing protein